MEEFGLAVLSSLVDVTRNDVDVLETAEAQEREVCIFEARLVKEVFVVREREVLDIMRHQLRSGTNVAIQGSDAEVKEQYIA